MVTMNVKLDGDTAVFTLANGDVIRVSYSEAGCGVDRFGLNVMSNRGRILVKPSAGNACVVLTEGALIAEAEAVAQELAKRRAIPASSS